MDNFKYKAWDKVNKRMIDLYSITPCALDSNLKMDGIFLPFSDDYELLQPIGLADKNGKQIYRGHIIRGADGSIGVVDYRSGAFTFNNEPLGWTVETHYGEELYMEPHPTASWAEIIGNIFENSELLEVVNE